uniref:Uncharacterized protein n=1 Tax=Anguilla anguilla TaxID=7936 RepID=A0A0E9V847_ANGAN
MTVNDFIHLDSLKYTIQ